MHGRRNRQVLNLYRSLINAGRSYPDYNIRDYVVRRVRQDFRKNVGLEGSPLAEALAFGTSQLSLINRQAAIAASYPHELSVMEGSGAGGSSSSGSLPSTTRASAVAGAAGPAISGLGAQEAGGEDEEEPMIARPRDMA